MTTKTTVTYHIETLPLGEPLEIPTAMNESVTVLDALQTGAEMRWTYIVQRFVDPPAIPSSPHLDWLPCHADK